MTEKRQFTEEEKRFATKNLEMMKTDLEYKKKVDLPNIQLVLDTADLVVKRQLQQKEYEKKKVDAEIEELENAIKVLEDQIENGVEVKSENTSDNK